MPFRLGFGELPGVISVTTPHADAPDLAYGQHGGQVRTRLRARSENRQIASVFMRQQTCRYPTDARCTDRRDVAGVEDRLQNAMFGLEEQDGSHMRVVLCAMIMGEDTYDFDAHRRDTAHVAWHHPQ